MLSLDLPLLEFDNQKAWRVWLQKNYSQPKGIWMKFYKKATGLQKVTYDQALEEALCFGWIDGQVRRLDDKAYIQRFTPRRAGSAWSHRNTQIVDQLIKAGKMTPVGQKLVDEAKKDGRWELAYSFPQEVEMPSDFLEQLKKNKVAERFFQSLNKANRYAVYYLLTTAKKPETRERRIEKFIGMFSRGEKIY